MTEPATIIILLVAAATVVLVTYGCRWLNDHLDRQAERDARERFEQFKRRENIDL